MARSHQEVRQNDGTAGYGVSVVQFPKPSVSDLPQIGSQSSSSAASGDDAMERKLESIIIHRRARQDYFPRDMFADPAWDIFLDLALAEKQQRRVSISSLCMAAQVPATTALRWIKHLTEDGWLVRQDDPLDARRTFISLARDTSLKMHAYIAGIEQNLLV